MNVPFIDIHTHRSLPGEDALCSCGIHPWWLDEEGYDWENDLQKLEVLLKTHRLAAIGEAGIDRIHRPTLPLQMAVLEQQILLSEKYQKPLILHNVRGNDLLMMLHKRYRPRQPWILHGFNGSVEEVKRWTEKGCYFSVGEALLFKNRKITESIKSIPLDHLFFETDTSTCEIAQVYSKASEILEVPILSLKEKIFTTFAELKLNPWKTGENAQDSSSAMKALIDLGKAMY